jgi:hypothetical protein
LSNSYEKQRTANIGFAKWRVKCFYDSLVQGSTFGILMNICAKNPPLRKAENRWAQAVDSQKRDDRVLKIPVQMTDD